MPRYIFEHALVEYESVHIAHVRRYLSFAMANIKLSSISMPEKLKLLKA